MGGAIIGIIFGLLIATYIKVGGAILAAIGGFAIGLILNEAFMWRLGFEWVFWTTNVLCMVTFAFLSLFFYEFMVILATTAIGSF